jgi:hypothetical protein
MLTQRVDMKRDGLAYQLLDLFTVLADSNAARKIGHIRAPSFSLLLDDYDILSHAVSFPTYRPAARSSPAYRWAPRRLAFLPR